MVFNEILPSAQLLTINVFGNYVIQKFFELGTTAQKLQLLQQMKNKILDLTLNMYGCRVVQKALELCDHEGQVNESISLPFYVIVGYFPIIISKPYIL